MGPLLRPDASANVHNLSTLVAPLRSPCLRALQPLARALRVDGVVVDGCDRGRDHFVVMPKTLHCRAALVSWAAGDEDGALVRPCDGGGLAFSLLLTLDDGAVAAQCACATQVAEALLGLTAAAFSALAPHEQRSRLDDTCVTERLWSLSWSCHAGRGAARAAWRADATSNSEFAELV